MARGTTSPKDIATLADLHRSGELDAPDEPCAYKHDASINERVSIWRGNIVLLESDVIVNAANSTLLGGGGVDGAIHRAAGRELYRECKTLDGAETGETKFTKGYNLPSRFVAHTVGPVYSSSDPQKAARLLESCYKSSLEGCKAHKGGSIGFSSISTGIYGYPMRDATRIALETTRRFLEQDDSVTRVIYVVFSEKDEAVYKSLAATYFPGPDTPTQQDRRGLNASTGSTASASSVGGVSEGSYMGGEETQVDRTL